MPEGKIPASLDVAVFSTAAAAAGYCAKLVIEAAQRVINRRSERRSRLVELQALLLASRYVYTSQSQLRNRLRSAALIQNPKLIDCGYDEAISAGFANFNDEQKKLHGLIRSYTMTAQLPLNRSMLDWLAKDTFFKAKSDELGIALRKLEAHLILWCSKYEYWIPNRPEGALVYLNDREKHGVGFPAGIEQLILKATGTEDAGKLGGDGQKAL